MFDLTLIPAAFIAGVLMFLAPCTLPIVPGYLVFIAGAGGRVVRNAFSFVFGFSTVFILFGLFAGLLGSYLGPYREFLAQLAGLVLLLFGLTMLGLRIPILSNERHLSISKVAMGKPWSSFLIGALFALGWSPCIGPILGTVLLLASQSSTALMGAMLLGVFSLGLGIPFILTAFFINSATGFLNRLSALTSAFTWFGALTLILTGALMLTGYMAVFVAWALSFFDGFYNSLLPFM